MILNPDICFTDKQLKVSIQGDVDAARALKSTAMFPLELGMIVTMSYLLFIFPLELVMIATI